MTAQELHQRLLYRDGLMLVIDKPAGLPVHAGPGGGETLEDHLHHLTFGLPNPPFLAHRLDRDTSGCLILGRHRKALSRLGRLFSDGAVAKRYWAVVRGGPPAESGQIDLPLRKDTSDKRRWRMVVDRAAGQSASTGYRVMGRGEGVAWLELSPKTGRTHQIRVHLEALGCPLVGELQYGRDPQPGPLHLHAWSLTIPLYPRKDPIQVYAAPPVHMLALLSACGYKKAGA